MPTTSGISPSLFRSGAASPVKNRENNGIRTCEDLVCIDLYSWYLYFSFMCCAMQINYCYCYYYKLADFLTRRFCLVLTHAKGGYKNVT